METSIPTFPSLTGKDDATLLRDLRWNLHLIQEVTQLSRYLKTVESPGDDELSTAVKRRQELVDRLEESSSRLNTVLQNNPHRSEIETELRPFIRELVRTDSELVTAMQMKKQAVVVQLGRMQQQKKVLNYLR